MRVGGHILVQIVFRWMFSEFAKDLTSLAVRGVASLVSDSINFETGHTLDQMTIEKRKIYYFENEILIFQKNNWICIQFSILMGYPPASEASRGVY